MSTRCNVLIQDVNPNRSACAYRHCDGYPSVTGKDLENLLKKYKSFDSIVTELVLTDGLFKFDNHWIYRDIEYLYRIIIFPNYTELICEHIDFMNHRKEIFSQQFVIP